MSCPLCVFHSIYLTLLCACREQQLANALRTGDHQKAVRIAMEIRQPARLMTALTNLIRDGLRFIQSIFLLLTNPSSRKVRRLYILVSYRGVIPSFRMHLCTFAIGSPILAPGFPHHNNSSFVLLFLTIPISLSHPSLIANLLLSAILKTHSVESLLQLPRIRDVPLAFFPFICLYASI